MTPHLQCEPQLDEAMDLYLLEALPEQGQAEVRGHLGRNCAACRHALAAAQARAAAFALAAAGPSARAPGPEVKARLLAAVAGPQHAPSGHHKGRHWSWGWTWGPLAVALAIACLVLFLRLEQARRQQRLAEAHLAVTQQQVRAALALVRQQAGQRDAEARLLADPATRATEVSATPAAPRARAFVNPSRGVLLLVASLPPAAAAHTYEMWLLPRTGKPVPAGTFQTSTSGAGIASWLHPLPAVAGVAVSLEPAGGSAQPTGPIVLAARFPASRSMK